MEWCKTADDAWQADSDGHVHLITKVHDGYRREIIDLNTAKATLVNTFDSLQAAQNFQ